MGREPDFHAGSSSIDSDAACGRNVAGGRVIERSARILGFWSASILWRDVFLDGARVVEFSAGKLSGSASIFWRDGFLDGARVVCELSAGMLRSCSAAMFWRDVFLDGARVVVESSAGILGFCPASSLWREVFLGNVCRPGGVLALWGSAYPFPSFRNHADSTLSRVRGSGLGGLEGGTFWYAYGLSLEGGEKLSGTGTRAGLVRLENCSMFLPEARLRSFWRSRRFCRTNKIPKKSAATIATPPITPTVITVIVERSSRVVLLQRIVGMTCGIQIGLAPLLQYRVLAHL
jgi:hypothetical protein